MPARPASDRAEGSPVLASALKCPNGFNHPDKQVVLLGAGLGLWGTETHAKGLGVVLNNAEFTVAAVRWIHQTGRPIDATTCIASLTMQVGSGLVRREGSACRTADPPLRTGSPALINQAASAGR